MSSEVRTSALLLALATPLVLGAFLLPGEVFFDFGPNDARYVTGFREDFEIDEPTLIHWSGTNAGVRLPYVIRGPYDVTLRYKRHVELPAEVRVFLGGEPVAAMTVPRGDFTLTRFHHDNTGRTDFELRLLSRSEDGRPLGLALDWLSVRPARPLSLFPQPPALLALLSWVAAFYLVPRLLGLSRRTAFACGLGAALALASMSAANKFWAVHAALTLGARAHVVAGLLVLVYRVARRAGVGLFQRPEARWAFLLVYVGLAVRLFATFHPDFYYPDVRTHSKFVSILWTEGLSGFFTDYIENQHRHLLGLQYVGDRWVAFPYPPLLYLSVYPLSRLSLPVDDWMKLVPASLAALEALAVFTLASRLGLSARAALVATALHATARVIAFRLAVASYAAMFGHFWDVMAVWFLVHYFERMGRPLYAAGFAALVAISVLSYAGSALVLGLFVPSFCLAFYLRHEGRPPATRPVVVAASALVGAVVALVAFYGQYVPELFPQDGGEGQNLGTLVDFRLTPFAAISMAWYRMGLFYGPTGTWTLGLPVFTCIVVVATIVLRRREFSRLTFPLVGASLATYLGLNFLRAGLGDTHIFQFTKDDLVVLPLVVMVLGLVFDRCQGRRAARLAASGMLILWVSYGLWGLARDVRSRFIRPDYPPRREAAVVMATGEASGGVDDPVASRSFRSIEGLVRELEELHFVVRVER